ncbi:MAG: hypothetical protein ACF8Q5_08050 [Phycisphaerales bacterium JB040]
MNASTTTETTLHDCLCRFASAASRLASLESSGTITADQAARQISELYFELTRNAARCAVRG